MRKKIKVSQDELDTFHQAVEGTKPLIQKKIRLSSRKNLPTKVKQAQSEASVLNFNESDVYSEVGSEEFIEYKQASVSNKILRKLRKGQYNVGATLDLHGLSVDEARIAVKDFLQENLRVCTRVVLLIHGKGRHQQSPILKNKLNHWLRELNVVLAFCSASNQHGSRGAMYVLLKRLSKESPF